MPKARMTREAVASIRGRILDSALEIIIEEGFNNLSIRKVASRLGITATTIYNYYTNKDELNLMIRIRGFEKLHDLLILRAAACNGIEERFAAMVRAYVEFGLTNPSYYDIMFNLHTPKYLDYVGTDIEPLALQEKQNALKCQDLFIAIINAYVPGTGAWRERFILYQFVKFWSDLHGLVTLCNSRLFHEVLENVEAFVEQRTSDAIHEIMSLKERIEADDTQV
ncbi:MAG: TetR/AcrR family transcriptional regulator [Syntrophaceae bacterium]